MGTSKTCLVQLKKNGKPRFDYKKESDTVHQSRFISIPNSMESLSQHTTTHQVDFKKHAKRSLDFWADNKFIQHGAGRKQRLPETRVRHYDEKSKDTLMGRTDFIVP